MFDKYFRNEMVNDIGEVSESNRRRIMVPMVREDGGGSNGRKGMQQ